MDQLIVYIKSQLQLGVSKEIIASQLAAQGWTKQDIDQAFVTVKAPASPVIAAPAAAPLSPAPQTQTPFRQSEPVQNKKSSTGVILIILVIILLLVGIGIYFLMAYAAPAQQPTPLQQQQTQAPIVQPTTPTNAPAVNAVPTTTPTFNAATPSKPVATPQSKAPAPQTKIATTTTFVWQTPVPSIQLCWSSTTGSGNCTAVNHSLVDLKGNGSILLGATEYCQYLDANGSTLDMTPQNIWRLPTHAEQAALTAALITTFPSAKYWSSTVNSSNSSLVHFADINDQLSDGSHFSSFDSSDAAAETHNIRCVRWVTSTSTVSY